MQELGKALKHIREQRMLSARDIEKSFNISNAYITQIENNRVNNISLNKLIELCKAYKIILKIHKNKIDIISENGIVLFEGLPI